ncbi:MAG: hypothetical protein ACYDCL_05350 [Myxococcales bacterium]
MPVLLLRLVAFSAAGWTVTGSGRCPSPEAVRARLLALLPGSDARARIEGGGDEVRVELLDGAGRVLAARSLPRGRSCAAMVEACAVVLAAAAMRLVPIELPQAPEATPQPAAPLPPIQAAPAPPPPRAEPKTPPPAVAIAVPPTAARSFFVWGLSAALSGTFAGAFSPAAQLLTSAGTSSGWFGQVELSAEGARSLPLGAGAVDWQRFALSAGAARRLRLGIVALELAVRGAGSALVLGGHGFGADLNSVAVDPGVELAVRALFGRGSWRPWLGASGTAWLQPEAAVSRSPSATVDLPQLEAFASLGIDFEPVRGAR